MWTLAAFSFFIQFADLHQSLSDFLPPSESSSSSNSSSKDGDSSSGAIVGCQEEERTYGVGEEWFEGCEFRCQCSDKLEILCQPRCKVSKEKI